MRLQYRRDSRHRVMQIKYLTLFLAAFFVCSCAATQKPAVTANSHPENLDGSLWEKARDSYIKAEATGDKQKKAALAKEGLAYAEECVMKEPENAACYYYRAMNNGVYYSAHVFGYQSGIRSMIEDCKKAAALDEKFDHAGAYRTLGKIYTDMPEIFVTKNGVSKDIDLAIKYLDKAVQIDGSYPENYLYLAAALSEADKKEDAVRALSSAGDLVPMWKNHRDYAYWKKLNTELTNKLK